MKSNARTLARALDAPDPNIRFYLFHGYDPGESNAAAERLLKGLGAERSAVAAQSVKADSALLADEAGAIGLFGGKRAIWIQPAGDEICEGVEALLAAPAAESPVIAVAGVLRKSSKLLQLAESDPQALAHMSRELSEADLERVVEELARAEGLRLAPGIGARIAAAAGGGRGIIAQELTKLALYAGASPEAPALVDREALDAVGTGSESDWSRVGDLALAGDIHGLGRELSTEDAMDPIPILRAMQRRVLMLAPLRSRVDHGQRPHDVVASAGKSVFFKDKSLVTSLLSTWDSAGLARLSERIGALERKLMRSDSPPSPEAMAEELITIGRTARRR